MEEVIIIRNGITYYFSPFMPEKGDFKTGDIWIECNSKKLKINMDDRKIEKF